MVIEIDKILTPAITTLITSSVTGLIGAVSVYFVTKKQFENNTRKEIAKFNLSIKGLREEIDNLEKSRKLLEELKQYLENYLENSNKTGNN
jgi:uncharacterized membrane protein (DUF106 family)